MAKTNNNAADVKNAAAKKTTNNNNNAAKTAAKEYAKLSPVDVVALSAAWVKEYGTIRAIRDNYAALVEQYGKDNFAAVLKNAQTIRTTEIDAARETLAADVFTFSGISAAVFNAVAKSAGYAALCQYARRQYDGTDAERAAAVIGDYFANVDANGAPVAKVSHVSADGLQILVTFERKKLTFGNAVAILKASLDGMASAAKNAATRTNGNDAAPVTRKNVRAVGRVVAVYAAAVEESGRVSFGERRDTSKEERVRNAAAEYIGNVLPVGYVPVTTWNAAIAGNEDAAAAVDAAKDAAKDAAAAAGHAAAVKE